MYIKLLKEDLINNKEDVKTKHDQFEFNLFRIAEELDSILLPIIKKIPIGMSEDSVYVAGGCIYRNLKSLETSNSLSMFFYSNYTEKKDTLKEALACDIDLYFDDKVMFDQFDFHTKTKSFIDARKTENSICRIVERNAEKSNLVSAFRDSLKKDNKEEKQYYCVDMVNKLNTRKGTLDSFDLSCCQIAYSLGSYLFIDTYAESLHNNTWQVNVGSVSNAYKTYKRILKYSRRGATFTNESLDKFYLQIAEKKDDLNEAKKHYNANDPDCASGY